MVLLLLDYYPFGMLMPGRTYQAGSSPYRFGLMRKERSDEIHGSGNAYDFGARMQDPRLGRWFSIDPLQSKYPDLAPYAFVANSPLNAVDPDGRLIIFINGLWGSPTGARKGGTDDYWGRWGTQRWTEVVQKTIGDSKKPLYYDGSVGGVKNIFRARSSNIPENRIAAGKDAGYKDAASIINKLDKGETIKIVTNSMGAAFERGFTQGLLQYQTEENQRRSAFNDGLDKQLSPLYQQKQALEEFKKAVPEKNMTDPQRINNELNDINSKINVLESQKKEMLNVKIEMVIDLSSHQIDYADPNAQSSYYMTAGKANMNFWERTFVDEKTIKGAKFLGGMSGHHSSNADPTKFPSAANRN
ncbi:MAG TPA: RHS repeat-associated core domain-containing protein [Chitinophagaceae bacterium]|nr:RHS repeat-associated core domain-containing protein [Chitinophagaceae bacterium]